MLSALCDRPDDLALETLLEYRKLTEHAYTREQISVRLVGTPSERGVEALLEIVRNTEEADDIRIAATEALVGFGREIVVDALLAAFSDTRPGYGEFGDLQVAIVQTLSTMMPTAELAQVVVFESHFARGDGKQRAIQALGLVRDDQTTDALIEIVDGYDSDERTAAFEILSERPGDRVSDALVRAFFRSKWSPEKLGALRIRLGAELVPLLIEHLHRYSDRDNALRALQALMPARDVSDALVQSLLDSRLSSRAEVAAILSAHPSAEVVDRLVHLLLDERISGRTYVAAALRPMVDDRVAERLLQIVHHDPENAFAITALGAHPGQAITRALITTSQRARSTQARVVAVESLADRSGDEEVSVVLIRTVRRDRNFAVRAAAARALQFHTGTEVDTVLIWAAQYPNLAPIRLVDRVLRDPEGRASLRRAGVVSLATRHESANEVVLLELLVNALDPDMRSECVRALQDWPGSKVTSAFLNAMDHDPDAKVRAVAARSLENRLGDQVTTALIDTVQYDDSDGVRFSAAAALAASFDDNVSTFALSVMFLPNRFEHRERFETHIAAIIKSSTSELRAKHLIDALRWNLDSRAESLAAILHLLRSDRPIAERERAVVLTAGKLCLPTKLGFAFSRVGQVSGDDATHLLVEMTSRDSNAREYGAYQLGKRPGQNVTDVLNSLLSDDTNYAVRAAAAESLRDRDGESTTAILCAALTGDPHPWVRRAAAGSLRHRPSDQAVEALLTAMHDTDDGVWKVSIDGLSGRNERRVIDALCQVLRESATSDEPRYPIQRAIVDALSTIPDHDDTITSTLLITLEQSGSYYIRENVVQLLCDRGETALPRWLARRDPSQVDASVFEIAMAIATNLHKWPAAERQFIMDTLWTVTQAMR